MHLPQMVNYLAVLVAGIVMFLIGGVWYGALFKNKWAALQGLTGSGSMGAGMYVSQLVLCLITAWVLAVVMNHFTDLDWMRGAQVGILCWLGFEATKTYGNVVWLGKPRELWVIDAGHGFVTLAVAGAILAVWR
jgi:Protein of unknown function (DUF1761)